MIYLLSKNLREASKNGRNDWAISTNHLKEMVVDGSTVYFVTDDSFPEKLEYNLESNDYANDFVRRIKEKLNNLKLFGQESAEIDLSMVEWETVHLTKNLFDPEKWAKYQKKGK